MYTGTALSVDASSSDLAASWLQHSATKLINSSEDSSTAQTSEVLPSASIPPIQVPAVQQAVVTSLWSPKSSESLLQALSALSSDMPIPANHMANVVNTLHAGPPSPSRSEAPRNVVQDQSAQILSQGLHFQPTSSSSILNDKVVLHRLMGQYFDGPHREFRRHRPTDLRST